MNRLVSRLTVLALIAVIALSVWWIQRDHLQDIGNAVEVAGRMQDSSSSSGGPGQRTTRQGFLTPDSSILVKPDDSGIVTLADIAATADQLNAPSTSVEADLEIIQAMIDYYRRLNNGEVPGGGLNEEIVDEMRGRNDRKVAVFPATHPAISAEGKLLDRWGTPYFFHPISRGEIQIRSAGPDGVLWTADDVQTGGNDVADRVATAGE